MGFLHPFSISRPLMYTETTKISGLLLAGFSSDLPRKTLIPGHSYYQIMAQKAKAPWISQDGIIDSELWGIEEISCHTRGNV